MPDNRFGNLAAEESRQSRDQNLLPIGRLLFDILGDFVTFNRPQNVEIFEHFHCLSSKVQVDVVVVALTEGLSALFRGEWR